MPSDDLDLVGYEPSFIEDGQGIGQANDYLDEDLQDWDTRVRTQGADDTQDQSSDGSNDCTPPDADTSKIYLRATHYVDGEWVCYWIDTTTCS